MKYSTESSIPLQEHEINVKHTTGVVLIPGMDPSPTQGAGQGVSRAALSQPQPSVARMIQSQHDHTIASSASLHYACT